MTTLSVELYKRFVAGESINRLAEWYNLKPSSVAWHINTGREQHFEEVYIASRTQRPTSTPAYTAFASEGGAHYVEVGDDVYVHYGSRILKYYCRSSQWEYSKAFKRLTGVL